MKLFFVAGSSGVGKTTILSLPKANLPENFIAHDFDEKLTKEVEMDDSLLDAWRYKTTKYWIDVAQMNAGEDKILLSWVWFIRVRLCELNLKLNARCVCLT